MNKVVNIPQALQGRGFHHPFTDVRIGWVPDPESVTDMIIPSRVVKSGVSEP